MCKAEIGMQEFPSLKNSWRIDTFPSSFGRNYDLKEGHVKVILALSKMIMINIVCRIRK
jgi:hypothetical protein